MTALFPPSSNASYLGSRYAAWFTAFYGVGWVIPGMIHSFLPDGGAGVIAGIDLSTDRNRVVAMFAWAGATQLAHGLLILAIGLAYRALVPMALAVSLIERLLLGLSGWVRHTSASGHHPPEHYVTLVAIPLLAIFLWLSLRSGSQSRMRPHTST